MTGKSPRIYEQTKRKNVKVSGPLCKAGGDPPAQINTCRQPRQHRCTKYQATEEDLLKRVQRMPKLLVTAFLLRCTWGPDSVKHDQSQYVTRGTDCQWHKAKNEIGDQTLGWVLVHAPAARVHDETVRAQHPKGNPCSQSLGPLCQNTTNAPDKAPDQNIQYYRKSQAQATSQTLFATNFYFICRLVPCRRLEIVPPLELTASDVLVERVPIDDHLFVTSPNWAMHKR
mmetsp:Transcript_112117/g.317822  ORF Transcript_112117/g.317822 Transcript_112117/m.317822 type:complete len:228 (-) Transcript_112117:308-991(-)